MSSTCIVKRRGLYLLSEQVGLSFGHEKLDAVGKESYINHIHFVGKGRSEKASRKLIDIIVQLTNKWPHVSFKIYRSVTRGEVTIRFHAVRKGVPNWSDDENGQIDIHGVA